MDGTSLLFEPFTQQMMEKSKQFNHPLHIYPIPYPNQPLMNYSELELYSRRKIKEILDNYHMEEETNVVILGESFSGPIATSITSMMNNEREGGEFPISGLILCCTFVANPRPVLSFPFRFIFSSPNSNNQSFKTNLMDSLIRILFQQEWLMKIISKLMFHSEKQRNLFLRAMKITPPEVIGLRLRNVLYVNRIEELRKCNNIPLLILRARNDWIVPNSAQQLLEEVFEGNCNCPPPIVGSHFLLQNNPEETSEVIWKFVQNLPKVKS
ncbi:predicted protein [Naegleria gruberi]|uniref:Predicted protein n=1 Tax=Naegleria gruberi TaxID=5762 RepID=D2W0M6_NAEGR|nr:uncharacterized protein NAEGRDRAFT_74912 [Naegleria gruberi]EFC37316.1 predicted protein [Naegleria gruberi]|eukprot:XP_002670060.1 predicted protein [Naegleria gruberi strain NEG-M]